MNLRPRSPRRLSHVLSRVLCCVLLCCGLGVGGCAPPTSPPAKGGAEVSGAAAQPLAKAGEVPGSGAVPTVAPVALPLPQAPAAPLALEVISAAGKRGALKLPGEVADARFDIWHASRAGDDRIALIMRPGDVLAASEDEGRTWRVWRSDLTMHHALTGTKTWWAVGKLDQRQRATRMLESNDAGRTWRIKATDNNLDPEPMRLAKHGRTLALATGDDLLLSGDLGGKWRFVSPGLNQTITALLVHGDTWWMGGVEGAVASSTSPGKRWRREQLPTSAAVRGLAFAADGAVYAATDAGLWRRDAPDADADADADAKGKGKGEGASPAWREVALSAQRRLYGVAVLGDGAVIAYGERGALLVSRDGGAQWTDVSAQPRDLLKRPAADAVTWRHLIETRDGGWLLLGDDATIVRAAFK